MSENEPLDSRSDFTDLAMDNDAFQDLMARCRAGDKASRRELSAMHLRLVVKVAKQYRGNRSGKPFLELVRVGNLGLLKAIDRFDGASSADFLHFTRHLISLHLEHPDNAAEI